MSGLKNTAKRAFNMSIGKGYKTNRERRLEKDLKHKGRLDEMFASADMPDEEMIRRNERRKAAARRGSRQRNVLTDDDGLGG